MDSRPLGQPARAPEVSFGRVRGSRVTQRWYRPVALGLTVLILAAGAVVIWAHLAVFASADLIGVDLRLFAELGRRWVETGSIYASWQFSPYAYDQAAGTNDVGRMPGLYPPIAGPFFATVRFVPAVLWWVIPAIMVGYALWRWRPDPRVWPVLAAATLFPSTSGVIAAGGSTMWVTAGIAGGLIWGWPALIVALKPTFLPFLFLGADRRSWWLALGLIALVSILMLPEWVRYIDVLRNAESLDALYSVADAPLILVPVAAWLTQTSERPAIRPRLSAGESTLVVPPSWPAASDVVRPVHPTEPNEHTEESQDTPG